MTIPMRSPIPRDMTWSAPSVASFGDSTRTDMKIFTKIVTFLFCFLVAMYFGMYMASRLINILRDM